MLKYKDLIEQMTLEEKASLMSGKDFWQTNNIDRLNVPSMFLADGPHGVRKQMVGADHLGLNPSYPSTCFPTAVTIASTWSEEIAYELEKRVALEAIALKVSVILGPGTNIKRNPLCGRNFEYFSEDPYLAGKITASYIRGAQDQGISACVKHFACNNQELRRMVYDVNVDERALREIYLLPFEMAVKEGQVKTIMTSYNMVNGLYTNENPHLLVDILRNEWGYKNFIVTDWGGNNDRVAAIKTYNSLEMPSTGGETNIDIINAVKNGELDESVLDQNVDYLLSVVFSSKETLDKSGDTFDIDEHHNMALRCAEEGIVLLENNGVLPLKEGNVALIGDFAQNPRYQGAGSSNVNPTKLDKLVDCIKECGFNYVGFEKGFDRYGKKSKSKAKKALKLASKADVVIYTMGLDEVTESEGLDRKNLKIKDNQISLLKQLHDAGKKVVVVLTTGSPVEINFSEYCDAILLAGLPGQAGSKAILNIIEGKVNPSGKLAETYVKNYEDVPTSGDFPSSKKHIPYLESIFVGYRYFEKNNVEVKYPFGYGLSYTTFEYSNLRVTKDGVTFNLKNTGEYDGKEVVQLYIGLKDSNVYRPTKELKGFKKVFLKANEEKEVTISFDDKSFRYFNQKTNKWEIEGGNYDIYIGASSVDIKLEGNINIEGTTEEYPFTKEEIKSYFDGNSFNREEFEIIYQNKLPEEIVLKKKERIVVDYNTTVSELKNAKGWAGRFFAGAIRFAHKFLLFFGQRDTANMLVMSFFHLPMRSISRMTGGALSFKQLDGLMMMFNGKFWKGLGKFFKEGKEKKKLEKERKRLEKEKK